MRKILVALMLVVLAAPAWGSEVIFSKYSKMDNSHVKIISTKKPCQYIWVFEGSKYKAVVKENVVHLVEMNIRVWAEKNYVTDNLTNFFPPDTAIYNLYKASIEHCQLAAE